MNIDKKNTKDKEHKINISPIPKIEKKEDHVVVDGKKYQYEADEEFELRSCCGSNCLVDKEFMQFLAKTVVSLSVLGFCFLQLSQSKQSEFASSTISLILGTYLGSAVSGGGGGNNNNKK